MRKLKYIVSSDNHLQLSNWAKYPDLRGDAFHSFKQVLKYAYEAKAPVMLAGDVIDKRHPDAQTVAELRKLLSEYTSVQTPIEFIQGQHEYAKPIPWLEVFGNEFVIYMNTVYFDKLYWLDFTSADRLHVALAQIPSTAICLVAHQSWAERIMHASSEAGFCDVPYVRYIITGDFHAHRIDTFKGKHKQNIIVVSPGSTYMKNISEDPVKYFYLMYQIDDGEFEFESHKIETREVFKLTINSTQELDDGILRFKDFMATRKKLSDVIDKPIFHVEFDNTIPDVYLRLKKAAEGNAFLFDRAIVSKQLAVLENKVNVIDSADDQLEACLPQKLDPANDDYKLALRLLRSFAPKQEVEAIVNEATSPNT